MSRKMLCGCCDKEFVTDGSDEEARAEFYEMCPGHDIANAVVICGRCHSQFWAWVEKRDQPMNNNDPTKDQIKYAREIAEKERKVWMGIQRDQPMKNND